MCNTFFTDFYKSTGAYGYADLEWSFTTWTNDGTHTVNDNYDISVTLDLKNSHSSSSNRVGILVYNDTDFTVETIATIDGSGGDICTNTYSYGPLYRPSWKGKALRLVVYELFVNSDTQFNVQTYPSFIQCAYGC